MASSQPSGPDLHTQSQMSSPAPSGTPVTNSGTGAALTTGSPLVTPTPSTISHALVSPPAPVPSINLSTTSSAISYPQQALTAFETYKKKDASKVVVRFKATGNAPIMKNNYFRITAFNRFQAVIQFLRKELGWKQGDALFLYINSSFSPAPDDTVGNLFRCFGTEGHLIVNYSTQAAWG